MKSEIRHIFEADPRKVARSYQYYIKRRNRELEKCKRFGEKEKIDNIESKFFKRGK